MNTNDQLSALFAAALEQQEAAKAAVADLVRERKSLAATVEALKNASSSIQTATGSAASKAVAESLIHAPKSAGRLPVDALVFQTAVVYSRLDVILTHSLVQAEGRGKGKDI